jgi:hypothetical protein
MLNGYFQIIPSLALTAAIIGNTMPRISNAKSRGMPIQA